MKEKIVIPATVILLAALLRLVPHLPNFAPIGAMALFGGMYLEKKYAFIVPLVALFLSDIFLGFHATMPFVYGSFLLSGLIGLWIRQHRSVKRVVFGTLLSSVLFFLITNFGTWLVSGMYQKSPKGLIEAFVLALPFFRNTIFGDLLYTTAFIVMYELMKVLARRNAKAVLPVKK
jgi:uncharacterized membrane protein